MAIVYKAERGDKKEEIRKRKQDRRRQEIGDRRGDRGGDRGGEVLVTGTPGGVGFKRNPPIYLKECDKVDITISEIGTLSNTLQNEVL